MSDTLKPIEKICVLGGGSAGYLSAVALRRLLPGREVVVVQSNKKPVIGVGESTTAALPLFLHQTLGLERKRFYAEVEPSWKLGIRFIWGPPEIPHFNYTFSFELSDRANHDPLRKRAAYYCLNHQGHPGPLSALMDRDLSPCLFVYGGRYQMLKRPYGYHIDNKKFLAYLYAIGGEFGVQFLTGDVVGIDHHESGDVRSLKLEDGSEIEADLFVDCSGFESVLLGKALGEKFVDFADTLFCDSAIVSDYNREDLILPYTTAETMDHGWCWRTDLRDRVSLGYVHDSSFCSTDQAMQELKRKHPEVGDNMRRIKFPSGRYENFWQRNVIAIGNSAGFVEPLESTALHVIAEQLADVCGSLLDSDYRIEPVAREVANSRYRRTWDTIRDFLALHYKFNERLDTPFWRSCREHTNLREAQPIVDMYQKLGPHKACRELLPDKSLFQFEGYLAMLLGQRVPTACNPRLDDQDLSDWATYQKSVTETVSQAVSVRQALKIVSSPEWSWH